MAARVLTWPRRQWVYMTQVILPISEQYLPNTSRRELKHLNAPKKSVYSERSTTFSSVHDLLCCCGVRKKNKLHPTQLHDSSVGLRFITWLAGSMTKTCRCRSRTRSGEKLCTVDACASHCCSWMKSLGCRQSCWRCTSVSSGHAKSLKKKNYTVALSSPKRYLDVDPEQLYLFKNYCDST